MDRPLATPHELIQSFVAGLSDFITTLGPGAAEKPTRAVYFNVSASTTASWQADVDYDIVGWDAFGPGSFVLSTDGSNSTTLMGASPLVRPDGIIAVGASGSVRSSAQSVLRILFPKNSYVRLFNGGASALFFLLHLQYR